MKAKEAKEQEVRTLRAQNLKTSEIVSQLKDAESANRAGTVGLEKQLAELKSAITTLGTKSSATQQQLNEKNILLESLKSQVEELKKNLVAKDNATSIVSSAHRKAEVEIEALRVRLEEIQKSLESWKKKGLGNQSEEYEMLRVSCCLDLHHFYGMANADISPVFRRSRSAMSAASTSRTP
jgi:E3 ubiquitin-protein ligase BRE1